jgi:uncharacterized protein YeaO (DUF488 family)
MPKSENVFWHQELSPSSGLFLQVQRWKKEGIWNEEKFNQDYVHSFLLGIHHNPQSRRALNELCKLGLNKDIMLACYCPEESCCHRKILKGLIQGAYKQRGITNQVLSDTDESKYYEMYQQLNKRS